MKLTIKKIILFDGICNYCNALVNWAIRNDKKAVLKFATLQSETAHELKSSTGYHPKYDSMIFIENGNVYTNSDAAIRTARYFRWPAKIIYGLPSFPNLYGTRFINGLPKTVINGLAKERSV
jgi:predicted DCC family thiol-disulfide oxidoreductase YuxK